MPQQPKPLVLIVLDGWGHSDNPQHNAIYTANTPHWDKLWQQHPHTLISGSGHCVGLPDGQMGNSEVGHLNIGAGRIVHQDFSRIHEAIETGEFDNNPVFRDVIDKAKQTDHAIHVFGLLSPGGVHSHEDQILQFLTLAAKQGCRKVYLHCFLDGRDTPPQSAKASLERIEALFSETQSGQIASLIGRYYAMDRDQRWERVEQAYNLVCDGRADYHYDSAVTALEETYARGETDEFVKATAIHSDNDPAIAINDGDSIVFMNFRADRAREITRAFVESNFKGFKRQRQPALYRFVSLTEYAADIPTTIAYPKLEVANSLGEVLAEHGLKQLRIAETEKYAHVTFFFNGGVETPFVNEDRELIPSPKVATYDLQPEMSAVEVTDKIVEHIQAQDYDVIICNYANPDMVGHTGNFAATVTAIQCIDDCLGRIQEALAAVNGEMLITADHGNAECMHNPATNQPHTAHTSEPVPLVYVGRDAQFIIDDGKLSDIAPTILYLLGYDAPAEMTGRILLKCQ
ncbi:MAG: phosphoglycerate mutase (2,3-diphosphoglycerate-independent) [Legionellales bacterium]|nr:phosphoglycerate mutase (2,3-diphosphoglycerate-independent) [Legionellales bacterium]|tara:strand:+ start:20558 stop:22105 length:1548 start_codon:yes stop_codon:yes gene_type:complete